MFTLFSLQQLFVFVLVIGKGGKLLGKGGGDKQEAKESEGDQWESLRHIEMHLPIHPALPKDDMIVAIGSAFSWHASHATTKEKHTH